MSQRELDRLSIIEEVIAKRLTQVTAAKQVGLTARQLRRLSNGYKHSGAQALIPKRRGKPSNTRVSEAVRSEVIGLIQAHYHDLDPTLAHEKLTELHGLQISRESVRQLMIGAGMWKGKGRKRVRPIQQMRSRRPRFGDLVQSDHHSIFRVNTAEAKFGTGQTQVSR